MNNTWLCNDATDIPPLQTHLFLVMLLTLPPFSAEINAPHNRQSSMKKFSIKNRFSSQFPVFIPLLLQSHHHTPETNTHSHENSISSNKTNEFRMTSTPDVPSGWFQLNKFFFCVRHSKWNVHKNGLLLSQYVCKRYVSRWEKRRGDAYLK